MLSVLVCLEETTLKITVYLVETIRNRHGLQTESVKKVNGTRRNDETLTIW